MFTQKLKRQSHERLASAAWIVLLAAAVVMTTVGPMMRFGLVPYRAGLKTFLMTGNGLLAAAALAALAVLLGERSPRAWAALLLSLGLAWVPHSWMKTARAAPPIHDITTDPVDPPAFAAIKAAAYGGAEVALQQRAAYPDIAPLRSSAAPEKLIALAEQAARSLGWKIEAVDAKGGRLEATDTTPWFGFKDDVVVRVRKEGISGSRLDARSVSRVGRGDAGVNAKRIRAFLDRLPREQPPRS